MKNTLAAVLPRAASHRPVPKPDRSGEINPTSLDAFFDQWVGRPADAGLIAGAAVAVVRLIGPELVYARGYGHANRETRETVDPEQTRFRLASMSKLITWTALMQLVEDGRLGLDDDVNLHLRAPLKIPATYAEPVRVRHLLTHTAGFETNKFGYYLAPDAAHLRPLAEALARHQPARVRPPGMDANDGRSASYSDWGAALAGHIVALKSGLRFEDYVEEKIFRPCGMTHSSFREDPLPEHLASGYEFRAYALEPRRFEYFGPIGPAASLSASAADMAKFMAAQLRLGDCGNGARLLKKETAERMQARQLSPHPEVNGFGYGYFETDINGRRSIGHGGKSVWFRSEMVLLPEQGIGLFIAYNTSPADTGAVVTRFMNRYFPADLPPLKPPADFSRRAAQYEGSYSSTRRSYTRSEALFGFLISAEEVRATRRNTLSFHGAEWVEVQPDVFRAMNSQHTIAFLRDKASAAISHIVGPVAVDPLYKLGAPEVATMRAVSLAGTVLQFVHPLRGARSCGRTLLLLGLFILLAAAAPRLETASDPLPLARGLVCGIGLTNLLILAALLRTGADLMFDFQPLLERIPWYLRSTSTLALLSLALTLAATVCAVQAWHGGHWTLYGRLEYTAIVAVAVMFLGWLWRWNLLGCKHC